MKKVINKLLLLAIAVLLSASLLYEMPVKASYNASCSHENLYFVKISLVRYKSYDSQGNHVETWSTCYRCSSCHINMTTPVEIDYTVACKFTGNAYDDLGHSGENHSYRLKCNCGFTRVVTIPCVIVNGSHTKPF